MEALSPIPNPLPNDDEDVSWALSTAGALWGRGERSEALKWLRRAAEQASDVNDDVRALALFKAAADVSSQVSTTTPPPPSSSLAPPSTSVTPPPVASAEPPSTSVTPPPVASVAPAPGFPPPSQRASAPPPPPRKGPPSLPPRNSRPPLPPSRSQAPPPVSTQAPPPPSTQIAPPQAALPQPAPSEDTAPRPVPPRARQAQTTEAPPVTKVSRVPGPSSAPQISPTARSMPANGLADAAVPVRRPEAAPQRPAAPARTAAPARAAVPGVTVPTRPVAFSPSPVTTPLPGVAAERLPPSRRGRVFEEILGIPPAPGGHGFDDLDENTQVIQAALTVPISRKSTAQEVEESFHGLLAEPRPADSDATDEPTDPGLSTRSLYSSAVDETTGPVSVSERTAVWTPAERAAMMPPPDNHGPDITSRRFAPLLAHRVAVVASKTPGELRLVPLDTSGSPPVGAAIALLVPLSAADDDLVARLLGSLE